MCPVYAMPTRPSPRSERLGTPNTPAIRFTRGSSFEASLVRVCYGLSGCSPPWTDLTGFPQPPGAFTSRLPTGRSPSPSLDMTTTATGLLCWRDFHPQERQLASLHQIRRKLPDPGDKWHLDEVCVMIGGKKHWLWRAVDQDGVVLDVLVQSRRDKKAAKRLLRKLLKRQTRVPRVMITDKLASYTAAKADVMP